MSLDLFVLGTVPNWDVRLTAITNAAFGSACLVGLVSLTYLAGKFRDLPARAAYLPFGALLGLSATGHFAHSLSLLPDLIWVSGALRVLRVLCAVGAVVLLGSIIVRLDSLLGRERGALQRESELTAVLKELSSAYARLQNLDELKTQVFANVSHELRTPLTLILGPIQDLREAAGLTPEQQASLVVVERNAHLLLGHVNDLLELSRADAVGVELERKPTDVHSLLRALADSFRPLADSLGIEYQMELALSPRSHLVDPQKLERIAMNLLANAFKFTPSGGHVALRVEVAEESETGERRTMLVLAVEDSGPGIRVEDRERVFERFRQLDGKPNRAFSGTGLGLSIVREFVIAFAGSVRIEDSALGGARFVVSLPAEFAETSRDSEGDAFPASASSAEMQALRPRPTSSSESDPLVDLPLVLVVEDNPDMNRFVCSSLSSEFRVTSAFDGKQALLRLEHLTPDLIVTDFMMPHMSGDEFVHALRTKQEWLDIPVLVLTARDDVELRVRVLSAGVQDWLTKPFTVRELVARARNLVSARRARSILRSELATREFDVGELAGQLAERKRRLESLLESLSAALEHAEVASRFKTSLLRLVSHELRTPLGALQLQLERLSGEHRGPLNDAQQQLIARMRRSLARLTDMIQSLLEYARIESGRLELFVENFDLRELAQSVVDDFMPQAEAKGLSLRLEAADGSAAFDSDARLLRLVLVNLVSNALKFTNKGEVSVAMELDADGCSLRVQDTGPGIEPSLRASVFEPFFQGESAGHQQYTQGAGLGLSLVREMLHALGGSIELSSELGAGSTFRISVPRARPSQVQSLAADAARNTA
ncbi:MAG TPA: ATP-binding protein [Polyangiaceae bacterium]|nr:ATP-binding protein [Polyangiaceae bacterium]